MVTDIFGEGHELTFDVAWTAVSPLKTTVNGFGSTRKERTAAAPVWSRSTASPGERGVDHRLDQPHLSGSTSRSEPSLNMGKKGRPDS